MSQSASLRRFSLTNRTRQYRPSRALTFRPDGINAFAIASPQAQVQTIDRINGETVSTSVAAITDGDSLFVDARGVVISKALLDSGVAKGGGLSGSVAMPLAYVPVGEGEARMSVTLTEQGSSVKGRQLSASFLVKWSGNGVSGNLACRHKPFRETTFQSLDRRLSLTLRLQT